MEDNLKPVPEALPVPGVAAARRRKRISRPQNAALKPHRPGCKRALVIALLTGEGATFEGVQNAVNEAFPSERPWGTRTTTEGITLISSITGYWVEEDPDTGIIRAGFETGSVETELAELADQLSEEDAA